MAEIEREKERESIVRCTTTKAALAATAAARFSLRVQSTKCRVCDSHSKSFLKINLMPLLRLVFNKKKIQWKIIGHRFVVGNLVENRQKVNAMEKSMELAEFFFSTSFDGIDAWQFADFKFVDVNTKRSR